MTSWIIPIRVNPDDPTDWDFPLPKEEMMAAGWKEGDPLAWKENGDGTMTVSLKILKFEEVPPPGTVSWSDD
jgi:hypothetical protein